VKEPDFLRSVALFCTSQKEYDPADIIYVLPNKRSAMFMKMYVRETVEGVAFMPRFLTMPRFTGLFADRPEAPARELLFILYTAYRRAMRKRGREDGVREFDSFVFWGDMMLSDFDEIDRSKVNADDLFRNLRDIKTISANYLDEEQKDIIRRVWGESRLTAAVSDFWLHAPESSGDAVASRFVYLWEVMADVYHEYHVLLRERGVASPGGRYRAALERINALSADDFHGEHYVFVGFNDLSVTEMLMFNRLRELGVASFFWDTAPLRFAGGREENAIAKPLRRLRELVRNFPMPEGYTVPVPESLPEITVTACPSNIGQAKALHPLLDSWVAAGLTDTDNPLNTAVVLPDQGLLMPALLSIPSEINKVNISMGLSYRSTTFATLFHSIISMQLRAREIKGVTQFYFEDVNAVLAHPHIRLIASAEADRLSAVIAQEKKYNISASDIMTSAPGLISVFSPVRDLTSAADVAAYLLGLFGWLGDKLREHGTDEVKSGFEIAAIEYFSEEVRALASLVETYGVTMSERTFLHMFERIFSTRGLTVNGTPLAGLQVLGVLETRALDFDNVVILSMNERVFPRRQYSKTMIPGVLREGFGLPDFENLEWTYAYCFYRLIARARRVSLFYDSRTDGLGNGEISRYISQVRYLIPELPLEMRSLSYQADSQGRFSAELQKTDDVMRYLNEFKAGGTLRLSASALKTYKQCPMKFYLEYARRMRGSEEMVDYIASPEFGTLVHNVIQALFEGYRNEVITAATFDRWLDPANHEVDDVARRLVIEQRYPRADDISAVDPSAEARLAIDLVARIARANLESERDLYCAGGKSFVFIDNEYKVNGPWQLTPSLAVNFYMSIDRFDKTAPDSYRFVDFKTGDDDTTAADVSGLFNRNNMDKDGIFQLFTYAEAYKCMVEPEAHIVPVLHPMRQLSAGYGLRLLKVKKTDVEDYDDFRDEFRPLLVALVSEIFDENVPIRQCERIDSCKFCNFQSLCGRIPRDD